MNDIKSIQPCCEQCGSTRVVPSFTYGAEYFCSACGHLTDPKLPLWIQVKWWFNSLNKAALVGIAAATVTVLALGQLSFYQFSVLGIAALIGAGSYLAINSFREE